MPGDGPHEAAIPEPPDTEAAGAAGATVPETRQRTLTFTLAPEDLPQLLRLPGLVRAGRSVRVELSWHDTPDGALMGRNLALCAPSGPGAGWTLETLHPTPGLEWPAALPSPTRGSAPSPAGFEPPMPEPLAAVAAFRGRRHRFHAGDGATLAVLEGHLRGVSTIRPACRVELHGPALDLAPWASALAGAVQLGVPRAGLAAEAIAAARGADPPSRSSALVALASGQPLTDTVAQVVGGLLDTMLHWSATAGAGDTPVPVHQMRVATRRLRSALSIFRRAAACPEMAPLGPALRQAATCLGAARDWDVFLTGTGAQVATLFPDDRRVAALLAASRRRRAAAYGALRAHLASVEFRQATLQLACAAALRPWDGRDAAQDAVLQAGTEAFAAGVLARRRRRVQRAGRGLRRLSVPELHELRKDCKRLRYAAEFFQPLFPAKAGRRFVRRLAELQEALGVLNDGAAAAGLLAQLGRAGEGYAAGLVTGFVAAGVGAIRDEVHEAWHGFRGTDPFWA